MNRELFRIPKEFISRYSILGEDLPKYRTEFMRDRDRVMYCTAFKRLAGKTQIYTIGSDDHRKNRLTHSLEVAQIARTISRALGLNEELTEAIALGHDLGHTPFGHAGERMLHTIMCPKSDVVKDSPFFGKEADTLKRELERESASIPEVISYETMFGFKHNIQSVRVAVVLEDSYRGGKGENIGLNLTNYTLWGMMNHSKRLYEEKEIYPNFQNQFAEHISIIGTKTEAWSFEGYIVEWADDIAQWHHDLEDAVRGNALPVDSICKLIAEAFGSKLEEEDKKTIEDIQSLPTMDRKSIAALSHIVINTLVDDLCTTSLSRLAGIENKMLLKYPGKTTEELSKILYSDLTCLGREEHMKDVISLSSEINTSVFKNTIRSSVHHSKEVERLTIKSQAPR